MSDVSKVVYGNRTLIDLTNDTVSASNLLSGETAHGADGEQVTGTAIPVPSGGNAGQILGKNSNTSGDLVWISSLTANQKNALKALLS